MKNFGSSFSVQLAKFNSISETTRLPEYITALMVLLSSAIEDSQRLSIIAAASPNDDNLSAQSSNDEFLCSITYQSVASIIEQCYKSTISQNENNLIGASSAGLSLHTFQNRGGRSRNHGSPTLKYPSTSCSMYGHCRILTDLYRLICHHLINHKMRSLFIRRVTLKGR